MENIVVVFVLCVFLVLLATLGEWTRFWSSTRAVAAAL